MSVLLDLCVRNVTSLLMYTITALRACLPGTHISRTLIRSEQKKTPTKVDSLGATDVIDSVKLAGMYSDTCRLHEVAQTR